MAASKRARSAKGRSATAPIETTYEITYVDADEDPALAKRQALAVHDVLTWFAQQHPSTEIEHQ